MRDLVLVGGGHSHAIALLYLARHPLPGVRLTLISYPRFTPYSGMLPGYLAGYYSFLETHIDLAALARFAGARFIPTQVVGLDLPGRQVSCHSHPGVKFDYLSLDIGSTPAQNTIRGAATYAIAAKPVHLFLETWQKILQQAPSSLRLAIIGGGLGGVELSLNLQARLNKIFPTPTQIHLLHQGKHLVTPQLTRQSQHLEKLLQHRNIQLHLGETVTEVLPTGVRCLSGQEINADYTFLVTQASAPSWLKEAGLSTDSRGFVWIDDTLQSLSHPQVFAAGDIATLKHHPLPKAGVFAVRQGQPLAVNLSRGLRGEPLLPYRPQKRYLSLLGTGSGQAIALWGSWVATSSLFWLWKDYLDRSFMRQFTHLPSENL